MIKKKVCLLGDFSVGKTSLIRKYVLNLYSDEYISTVGVKVDKKTVVLPNGIEVVLLVWDMECNDNYASAIATHLRGMSGYFVVADGTRRETVVTAQKIIETVSPFFEAAPVIMLINKKDLGSDWKVDESELRWFKERSIKVFETSAKIGTNVETVFTRLTEAMCVEDYAGIK